MSQGGDESGAYATHLYVYGKVIRGVSPDGPIKPGADYQMTGKSEGFPDALQQTCVPQRHFAGRTEVAHIDPGLLKSGAFLYRPIRSGGTFYSLFSRIESRSEGGAGRADRAYMHCATVVVQDRWEPRLIPAIARLLYEPGSDGICFGDPNFEAQLDRKSLKLPPLERSALPEARSLEPSPLANAVESGDGVRRFRLRRSFPGGDAVALAADFAAFLEAADLAVHGRWLSFAMGVGLGAKGVGSDFALRYDNRDDGAGPAIEVRFSDSEPPVIFNTDINEENIDWRRIGPDSRGARGLLRDAVFWPEQRRAAVAGLAGAAGGERDAPRQDRDTNYLFTPDEALFEERIPYDTSKDQHARLTLPDDDRRLLHSLQPNSNRSDQIGTPEHDYESVLSETQTLIETVKFFDPEREKWFRDVSIQTYTELSRNLGFRMQALSDIFSNFHVTDDDKRISDELANLAFDLAHYALKRDPNELKPYLLLVFRMPAIDWLNLEAGERGHVLAHFFVAIFRGVPKRDLMRWFQLHVSNEQEYLDRSGQGGRLDPPYFESLFELVDFLRLDHKGRTSFDPEKNTRHRDVWRTWRVHAQDGADRFAQAIRDSIPESRPRRLNY